MPEHATSVIVLTDGRYRATCSCGMKGVRTRTRLVAEAQAESHLAYRAEVDAMTAPSNEGGT